MSRAQELEQDLAEKFARLVMPTLARLASNGESAEVAGWEKVRFEGKKRTWPEIRVKPRQDQGEVSPALRLLGPDRARPFRIQDGIGWTVSASCGPSRSLRSASGEPTVG